MSEKQLIAPIDTLDLDALEATLAKAMPGPWQRGETGDATNHDAVVSPGADGGDYANADAFSVGSYGHALVCESVCENGDAIVALRNAAPQLIEIARTLKHWRAAQIANSRGQFLAMDRRLGELADKLGGS